LSSVSREVTPEFIRDFERFESFSQKYPQRFQLDPKDVYPCLGDNKPRAEFDPQYVYHTAWAARKLAELKPKEHVDFSSFHYLSTICSAFLPIRFYDYHDFGIYLKCLDTGAADLTRLQFPDGAFKSVSCLHAVEHIGLGRYGDPLDPQGDVRAMQELSRVTRKGGDLLFAVPMGGVARIQFNAHRIYQYYQIIEQFQDFKLIDFALVPDDAFRVGIKMKSTEKMADKQKHGCGCFHFKKVKQ
jgi:SAM-dependent methyltransferase